ncbi:MAG TPA: hypothetical protein VKR55_02805 [Bradyrhizobium sp.]|uniref:hypothetical protein n=1 Tax=Bradyrhizobium sp. TaxID=376 RepID=UPI002B5B0771|nr:hypothetical protein [Bradyrhizobium sp.]HLZ01063.1 hypothetical protein [Bradyrhizobium sp.]
MATSNGARGFTLAGMFVVGTSQCRPLAVFCITVSDIIVVPAVAGTSANLAFEIDRILPACPWLIHVNQTTRHMDENSIVGGEQGYDSRYNHGLR